MTDKKLQTAIYLRDEIDKLVKLATEQEYEMLAYVLDLAYLEACDQVEKAKERTEN